MHGIILTELKRFVVTRLGDNAWATLLRESGLGPRTYVSTATYPDEEVVALVTAAARVTGMNGQALLENFGTFIAPTLLETYRGFVKRQWRTLDLLENTENTIHRTVRMREAGAAPPRLRATRVSPTEVDIVYTSPRRLCAVAEGIIHGVADHFKDNVAVTQPECMLRGDPQCRIAVRLLTAAR